MSAADISINLAMKEFEDDGAVSTDTFMAMTEAGVDATAIIEFFEENL